MDKKALLRKKLAVKRKSSIAVKDPQTKEWENIGEDEEILGFVTLEGPNAEIGLGFGITVQPKKFEAIRLDVHVNVPCKPSEAAIDRAFEFSANKCQEKLEELSVTVSSAKT